MSDHNNLGFRGFFGEGTVGTLSNIGGGLLLFQAILPATDLPTVLAALQRLSGEIEIGLRNLQMPLALFSKPFEFTRLFFCLIHVFQSNNR